jgi:hypothetical protein
MRAIKRVVNNQFFVVSFFASLVISTAFGVWCEWMGGKPIVSELLKGNRSAIYGALATIFGSLLGFVITAVSIVLGFSTSDRLAFVRRSKHYPALWRSFTDAIRVLGVATLTTLAALIFDRDNYQSYNIVYIGFFFSTWAIVLLCRSIWALENVVTLVALPSGSQPASSPSPAGTPPNTITPGPTPPR